MKQSLDLQLGQHLTITPQLQQAIRLLQLSSVELQQEIQEALESNPLLEEKDDEPTDIKSESSSNELDGVDLAPDGGSLQPTDLDMGQRSLDDDAHGDDNDWNETFDLPIASVARGGGDDELPDIDGRNSRPQTLREHLQWQMQMTPFSDRDRAIAGSIIDSISEDGYLSCTLEEIRQILSKEQEIEMDEVEAVLHQVQNFDPVGVAARDLSECLQLQLRALDPDIPYLQQARELATPELLALLASRDYAQLRKQTKLRHEDLQQAVSLIRSLNPRPGGIIQSTQTNYIVPDVIVRKHKGVWRAEMNSEVAPRLRINRQYEKLITRGDTSADNKYLQDQLQQARWFIKSLNSRNETLLKVARTIVDRQRAFFEHGPEAMKPLVLHDIAEAVAMHESTISRVTTNKYMLSPRGIYELKYFFSSHVGTADGGTCSATAIRSLIKKLVESELPSKPISDSKIAKLLEQQGINVARRTVAKYRESMNIPPSNQRKTIL
jgi:RNA polymerase sigma-54 factor